MNTILQRIALLVLLAASLHLTLRRPEPPSLPPLPPPFTPPTLPDALVPSHLDYPGTLARMRRWVAAAPRLLREESYGKSSKGRELVAFRLHDTCCKARPLPVLVTACIHGNEPLSSTVVQGYLGRLLTTSHTDPALSDLVDRLDIAFVPVVCPDSFPHARHCDGVDPNRNFNGKPIPPIAALKSYFLRRHFTAALSGHTYGRVFLRPLGRTSEPSPHEDKLKPLFDECARLAHYKSIRACQLYGSPIQGSEVDFYYDHNAVASCVLELGTHQHAPTPQDTEEEIDRTWPAFIHWLRHAPSLAARTTLSSPAYTSTLRSAPCLSFGWDSFSPRR